MTCPHCTAATQRSHWEFAADCKGCIARGVARAPHYRRCRDAGQLDRGYRQHLAQAGVTHEQVKAAAKADFETKAQAERRRSTLQPSNDSGAYLGACITSE